MVQESFGRINNIGKIGSFLDNLCLSLELCSVLVIGEDDYPPPGLGLGHNGGSGLRMIASEAKKL